MPQFSTTSEMMIAARAALNSTNQNDRVRRNTAGTVRERMDGRIISNVFAHAASGTEAISERIGRLDREWTVDRALMGGVAVNVILGLLLGRTVNRAWYLFPAAVGGFLLQHTLQGWCPPLAVFRRLGFRTGKEIELERNALKAIRGDYDNAAIVGGDLESRVARAFSSAA